MNEKVIPGKVGIVILNYNSYALTIKLVKQLNLFGWKNSIIVVDNGSSNESATELCQAAKEIGFVFIENERNAGYAAGNNIGLRKAYGLGYKYGLILNNDIEFDSSIPIDRMIETLDADESIGCVGPRIFEPSGKEAAQRFYRPSAWNLSLGIFAFEKWLRYETTMAKNCFPVYRAHGCCMMLRLSVMEKVGYMDESTFLYFEESILAEKMLEAGYKTYCCGDAEVLHNHSVVTKRFLNKWTMLKIYAKSANVYMKSYRGWGVMKRGICIFIKSLSMLKGWL